MSTVVCQGLQSCLEPRLVESQVLGLKLIAPKQHFLRPTKWSESSQMSDLDSDIKECTNENNTNNNTKIKDNKSINSNDKLGGWSLVEALTNKSQTLSKEVKEEKEKPYVHPLVKRSLSTLSKKSLELCTETLGSETGADVIENIDIYSSSSSESEGNKSSIREGSKIQRDSEYKKVNYGSLPPPLTSISGSNCFHIRPHREGGRLVMKAVMGPSSNACFQAERCDGRLKLHFLKNPNSPCSDSEAAQNEEQEQEEQEEQEEEEVDEQEEEIDGINENGGDEMGMEKFLRPSRCKEGGRGNKQMLLWEPFWVAT